MERGQGLARQNQWNRGLWGTANMSQHSSSVWGQRALRLRFTEHYILTNKVGRWAIRKLQAKLWLTKQGMGCVVQTDSKCVSVPL